MKTPDPLHRIVSWAHAFLGDVLRPGDLAVDLTAGNGGDTLFLYTCVGAGGRVLSFDIQQEALENTSLRLTEAGATIFTTVGEEERFSEKGIHLILDSHARFGEYCREEVRGVVANLGFRPGGRRDVSTVAPSTLQALHSAFSLLAPGGRLAVVAYVGHEGGVEEAKEVERVFGALPPERWITLRLGVPNRGESPFLLLAEKRGR